jgi:hypothetical protein
MGETRLGVGSAFESRPTGDKRAATRPLARNGAGEEGGRSTNPPDPRTITVSDGGRSRTPRWRTGKRQRFLFGSLIVLALANAFVGVSPRILGVIFDDAPPLDSCVTEQAVLRFLDGQTILSRVPVQSGDSRIETITLRKERISSLIIQSGGYRSILLRFNVDHENKQYLVEGSFLLTTSDSPSLHYHGWVQFIGAVVPSR